MVRKILKQIRLIKFISKGTALAAILALTLTSLPILPAQAKGSKDRDDLPDLDNQMQQEVVDDSNTTGVNAAINIMNNVTSIYQQQQQNLQNMQQTAAIASEYAPKETDALYFSHCRIPFSTDYPPNNACNGSAQTPTISMSVAQAYQQAAGKQIASLETMLNEAHNETTGKLKGIQCIESGKKDLAVKFKDKINILKSFKEKIQKQSQAFRDSSKLQIFNPLEAINGELYGDESKGGIDGKNRNFTNMLGNTTCSKILSPQALEGKKGLIGIRQTMLDAPKEGEKGMYQAANSFQEKDKFQMENEINKKISRIKKEIDRNGITAWVAKTESGNLDDIERGLTKFNSLKDDVSDFSKSFYQKYASTKNKIKDDLGYNLPELDKDFQEIVSSFSGDAETFFKKRFVNDCVTSKNDIGVGLPYDTIINGFKQPSARAGTTVEVYKRKLKNILDTDAGIEDLQGRIQALDSHYNSSDSNMMLDGPAAIQKNVYLQLGQEFGNKKANYSWTATELFRELINQCKQVYESSNVYSYNEKSALSYASKVKRAVKNINDLLAEEKSFADKLTTNLKDKYLNCEGVSEGTCSAATFNLASNDQACVKNLSSCATKINSCYASVQNGINKRTADSKQLANLYNSSVEALIANQEQQLKQISSQVFADLDMLKVFFKKGYNLPKELFVKMPEFQEVNGIQLRGGANPDNFLKNLPGNIDSLVQEFEEQQKNVEAVINDYVVKQKSAIETNKQKWEELNKDCKQAENKIRANEEAAYKAKAQKYNEQQEKISEFCNDYKAMRRVPGCDNNISPSELYNDMMAVASYLDKSVEPTIGKYVDICYRYSNEKRDDSGEDKSSRSPIAATCSVQNNLEDLLLAQVKKAAQTVGVSSDNIENFINGETDNLQDELEDDHVGLRDAVLALKALHDYGKADASNSENKTITAVWKEKGDSSESKTNVIYKKALENFPADTNKLSLCRNIKVQILNKALSNQINEADITFDKINDSAKSTYSNKDKYPDEVKTLDDYYSTILTGIKKTGRAAIEEEWRRIREGGTTIKCQAINNNENRNGANSTGEKDFADAFDNEFGPNSLGK